MTSNLAIIAAMAGNRIIGSRGTMPWHLPEDLKRFKMLTTGHPVIMGRKTHESILQSLGRPLPNRRSIVITRSAGYAAAGCEVVASLESGIERAGGQPAFVIGGAEIYALALPLAGSLYLTEISGEFEGDVWFPDYDPADWTEVARENHFSLSQLSYSFVDYRRNLKRSDKPAPPKRG